MEPSITRRKPIMSSNARESSSVYLSGTWTKVSHCSYVMQPQDGTRGPPEGGKKTNQPTPGAVLESSCFPGISLGLLGFPRAADSADKRSQWH